MRREANFSNDVTKILRKSMREKKRNDVMERERERERERELNFDNYIIKILAQNASYPKLPK